MPGAGTWGAFALAAQPTGSSFGHNTSPLTFAFLAVLIAYYLVSGIGLAMRMRALAQVGSVPMPAPGSDGN